MGRSEVHVRLWVFNYTSNCVCEGPYRIGKNIRIWKSTQSTTVIFLDVTKPLTSEDGLSYVPVSLRLPILGDKLRNIFPAVVSFPSCGDFCCYDYSINDISMRKKNVLCTTTMTSSQLFFVWFHLWVGGRCEDDLFFCCHVQTLGEEE